MRLTGVPMVVLALAATAVTGALTWWFWPRGGRWQPVWRTAGVLLSEALLVASVGLALNRSEQFYPSWAALAGDTGTTARTARAPTGRLDASLVGPAGQPTAVDWRAPGLLRWRLAGVPELVLPADYRSRPGDAFPVVLALVSDPRAAVAEARGLPGTVTVVAQPTRGTTGSALADLPAAVRRDVRVTAHGWALVAPDPLAAQLIAAEPPGFVAVRGWSADRLPAPLAAPKRLPVGMA